MIMQFMLVGTNRKQIKSKWIRSLGRFYNRIKFKIWQLINFKFLAKTTSAKLFDYEIFSHQTILLRNLPGLKSKLQRNKIINLQLSLSWFDGLLLKPGQIFSFWSILGKTTYQRGFVNGMVLKQGRIISEVGGGLCQLSNLIYWMTLHTPLKIVERWRHGYDVFPDVDRSQPFGSGATIAYPGIDLKIRNITDFAFQLKLNLTSKYLQGQWRCEQQIPYYYQVYQLDHCFVPNPQGGYWRYNKIYRNIFSRKTGKILTVEFITENLSKLRYEPLISNRS